VLRGLDAETAVRAMAEAMGSQAEVAAAAHLPGPASVTAFRVQGFKASVAARRELLAGRLDRFGPLQDAGAEGEAIWAELRALSPLAGEAPLWRINVPPVAGGAVAADLERLGARWLMDWAGGLVWAGFAGEAVRVRDLARAAGGHAQLVRAPEAMRARVPAFHPLEPGVAALEARVRRAFDPHGVFETGRF
jgi:glycolate oxidase FAD binding subunit